MLKDRILPRDFIEENSFFIFDEIFTSAEPAPEQPAAEVSQSAPAEAPVASSGYRSRRQAQNSYGDEQNTPAPAAPAESYQPAPVRIVLNYQHINSSSSSLHFVSFF